MIIIDLHFLFIIVLILFLEKSIQKIKTSQPPYASIPLPRSFYLQRAISKEKATQNDIMNKNET